MRTQDEDELAILWRAMGQPAPPARITQKAFDFDAAHLRRLGHLKPGERPAPVDLLDYAHDLRYTEIDRSLLAYLMPFCFEAWRRDLRGTDTTYAAFVEHFYPALAHNHVFETHLTSSQTAAIYRFMRLSILEEIDEQRGLVYEGMNARPYRWIYALTTYGVLLPDIELLWKDWWSFETVGRAVASVQYISALMYPDDENPVFAPWTKERGGGPPCLWEYAGHLYEHRWLEPNVDFLKRTLTPAAVGNLLERALKQLANEPEHDIAASVYADIGGRAEMLEARCGELPKLLATIQEAGTLLSWSPHPRPA